jgi:hypothetical protein
VGAEFAGHTAVRGEKGEGLAPDVVSAQNVDLDPAREGGGARDGQMVKRRGGGELDDEGSGGGLRVVAGDVDRAR